MDLRLCHLWFNHGVIYYDIMVSDPDPRTQFTGAAEDTKKDYQKVMPHYYGDTVRKLFLVGALLMLATLPLFVKVQPFSSYVPIFAIILFGLVAAWTSPAQNLVALINTVIAAGAIVVFEHYAAVNSFCSPSDIYRQLFLYVNLVLAVIFFFAFYYSIKTLRGYFFKK